MTHFGIQLFLVLARHLRLLLLAFIGLMLGLWLVAGSRGDQEERMGEERKNHDPPGASHPGERAREKLNQIAATAAPADGEEGHQPFLLSHGSMWELLREAGDSQAAQQYLRQLEKAENDPSVWKVVWDDPVGLILWPLLEDHPEFWDYYRQEREWLAEALVHLEDPSRILESIETLKRFHPYPKETLTHENLGPALLDLWLEHGPLIHWVMRTNRIPTSELFEVLFVGGSYLKQFRKDQGVQEQGSWLQNLYENHPHVWLYARYLPDILAFHNQLPQYADSLLERYGEDGVVELIHKFEEAKEEAARSILTFGDSAFHLLEEHRDDPRFRRWLTNPQVGLRLVPFLERFGIEEGMDRLEENPAWAAKYFDESGVEKPVPLVYAVPFIGGPTHVASNWLNGYPNEWSELGWAAFDIAGSALLVVSLGTTSATTVGGRAMIKAGQHQAVKSSARMALRNSSRVLRTKAGEGIRSGRMVTPFQQAIHATTRTVTTASSAVSRGSRATWQATQQLKAHWQSVSPQVRTATYRVLLAAHLIITLEHRTVPTLGETGAERLGEAAAGFADRVVAGMSSFMESMLEAGKSQITSFMEEHAVWKRRALTLMGILLLGIAGFWCLRPCLHRSPRT